MSNRIIRILMARDGCSEEEASTLLDEALDAFHYAVNTGDIVAAENVASDYLGLEPDYLDDFMTI